MQRKYDYRLINVVGKKTVYGFAKYMRDALYLETHHIIPLFEGGPDTVSNVIALCPNDHKKAHYWINKAEMRNQLFAKILL